MFEEALILGTPTVAALPDDVKTKVVAEMVALGKNVEEAFAAKKKLEWATRDEEDIFKATGIPKGNKADGKPEAYYDYRNRVLTDLKTKAESGADKSELEKYKSDLDAARLALKNNTGDAALKAEVEQAKQAVADEKARNEAIKKEMQSIRETTAEQLKKKDQGLSQFKTEMEFEKAKSKLTFKPVEILGEGTADVVSKEALNRILSTKPHEWRKGDNGSEMLVFLESDGTPVYNPEKGYVPYTLADYLVKELDPILDKGHQQSGAGTKPGSGGGGNAIIVDLGFAKSKTQVDEIIHADLVRQGLAKNSPEYQKKFTDARATVKNFAQLPLQ